MHNVNATIKKLKDIAHRMVDEVQAKRRPSLDNTPKRAKQARAKAIEADHLDRVREACNALVAGYEAKSLPGILFDVPWTKGMLLDLFRTRIDCPSYYTIIDTGEYRDNGTIATVLRDYVAARRGAADLESIELNKRLDRIRELEAKVKFADLPGFFPTPPAVVALMLEKAEIKPGMKVLEPSAGKGDIADAILLAVPDVRVICIEIAPLLADILEAKHHATFREDFLVASPSAEFDRSSGSTRADAWPRRRTRGRRSTPSEWRVPTRS